MGNEQRITLYTSDTCERCKNVKTMLDAHSVQYDEVQDRQEMLAIGLEGLPAIEVGGKVIDGYAMVLNWLRTNGYYSFEVDSNESD